MWGKKNKAVRDRPVQRGNLPHRFVNSPYSPVPQTNHRAILTATREAALIAVIHPDAKSSAKIRLENYITKIKDDYDNIHNA